MGLRKDDDITNIGTSADEEGNPVHLPVFSADDLSSEESDEVIDDDCMERSSWIPPHNREPVQKLVDSFVASMETGVGLSMAFDGVGILVLEAKLLQKPVPSLLLVFNGVNRRVPLAEVADIVVERACQDVDYGAWLVDLELAKESTCTFVFDGTEEGQREAHYFGGCLRALVHGVQMARNDESGGAGEAWPLLMANVGSCAPFGCSGARSLRRSGRRALFGQQRNGITHATRVFSDKPHVFEEMFQGGVEELDLDWQTQVASAIASDGV